jgi:hypothetical protein
MVSRLLDVSISLELTIATEETVVLHDVEHTAHLAEDENSRALLAHGLEELVKDNHLATVLYEMLVRGVWWSRFLSVCVRLRWNIRTLRLTAPSKRYGWHVTLRS